jgi:hypothetical protein
LILPLKPNQMRTSALFVYFLFLANTISFSQVWTNPITGTNPNLSNPYTTGDVTNSNISVSGIGRGSGIVSDNANNRYNASSWNTATLDLTAYFTFTMLKVSASIDFDLTSFTYTSQSSNVNLNQFAVRSSLDGFASDLATPPSTGGTVTLGAEFLDIPSSVEFRVYAWGATNVNNTFSINDFTFQGTAVLPVELIEFKAIATPDASTLKFTTASESNNSHFEIERSADSRNFTKIGEITGAGTTHQTHVYQFIDERPMKGINYYRLKQVDFDGSIDYSKVVSIRFGKSQVITVFPTLVNDQINIELEEASELDGVWEVLDMQGRRVMNGSFAAENIACVADLSQLLKGNYVLRVQVGQTAYTERIQKQ